MRLHLTLFAIFAACLLACGSEKPEGGACTFNPSTNDDDCAAGLFCLRSGHCTEACGGQCVKSCANDGECSGRTCSGVSSQETGLKKFCK